jgi:hypothetical protein
LIHLREYATKALEVDKNQLQVHGTIQLSEQIGNDGNSMWIMSSISFILILFCRSKYIDIGHVHLYYY